MPFVVATVGIRTRSGATRKPDHDVVNGILNDAYEPIVRCHRRAATTRS